jgi:hypothetical protein
LCSTLIAQNPVDAARQWRIQHQSEILQRFTALLGIPNVAADPANLRGNADTLVSLLRHRHFESRLLPFRSSPPVVSANVELQARNTPPSSMRITMVSPSLFLSGRKPGIWTSSTTKSNLLNS